MRNGWTLAGLALTSVLAACGGSSNNSPSTSSNPAPDGGSVAPTGTGADGGATALAIHIKNLAFSPDNLTVPAGATVQVFNDDGATPHSVTSEATAGSFTPGAVGGISFDTGIFTGGTRSFTIPASAANGTVVPYYCRNHLSMMTNAATVHITIGPASTSPTTPAPTTPAPTTPAPSTPSMPSAPGY